MSAFLEFTMNESEKNLRLLVCVYFQNIYTCSQNYINITKYKIIRKMQKDVKTF